MEVRGLLHLPATSNSVNRTDDVHWTGGTVGSKVVLTLWILDLSAQSGYLAEEFSGVPRVGGGGGVVVKPLEIPKFGKS
jgi:hypothetical protein